jgi:mRNA interferase MazF
VVSLATRAIALIRFPFSDLSQTKLRPALVLADAGRGDWIFCQITSQPYGDAHAIELRDDALDRGSLRVTSYARPGKLFTGSAQLATATVGMLTRESFARVIDAVIAILRP